MSGGPGHARIEIVAGALEAATAEMCASLIRSAYSPNIKERADCSTALCDMQGRTLSIATHAPAHLGSTLKLVPALLERFPIDASRRATCFSPTIPILSALPISTIAPRRRRSSSTESRWPSRWPSRTIRTSAAVYPEASPAIRPASSRTACACRPCASSTPACAATTSGRCFSSIRERRISAMAICSPSSPRWNAAASASRKSTNAMGSIQRRRRSSGCSTPPSNVCAAGCARCCAPAPTRRRTGSTTTVSPTLRSSSQHRSPSMRVACCSISPSARRNWARARTCR